MPQALLYLNHVLTPMLKSVVKKNGTLNVDMADFTVAGNQALANNQRAEYVQDIVDLTDISAIYSFQNHVMDESGNQNHGTATAISYFLGAYGYAAIFNGSTSKVVVPNSSKFNFQGEFDIWLLFNIQLANSALCLFSKRTSLSNGIAAYILGSLGQGYTSSGFTSSGFTTLTTLSAGFTSSGFTSTGFTTAQTVPGTIAVYLNGVEHTGAYSVSDNAWHWLRIKRDETNLVTVEIDGLVQLTVNDGTDYTTTGSLVLGKEFDGTYPFNGWMNIMRMFNGAYLTDRDANTILTNLSPKFFMKFGGFSFGYDSSIATKILHVKGYSNVLGNTQINSKIYNNMSPEAIMNDLITHNTSLIYSNLNFSTGQTLIQFIADGNLIDIVNDLAALAGWTFWTDGLGHFYFVPLEQLVECTVFVHGQNCMINTRQNSDMQLVNDLTVLGQNQQYQYIDNFTGDGVTTTFNLTYQAISTMVTDNGAQVVAGTGYTLNIANKTITFAVAPLSGHAIVVTYVYDSPLYIRQTLPNSIAKYGTYAKRLVMPWITSYEDGVKFVSAYLNVYGTINPSYLVNVSGLYSAADISDVVVLQNSVTGLNGSFTVMQIEYDYPSGGTTFVCGQFSYDQFLSYIQVLEKLHDIESSLTLTFNVDQYVAIQQALGMIFVPNVTLTL